MEPTNPSYGVQETGGGAYEPHNLGHGWHWLVRAGYLERLQPVLQAIETPADIPNYEPIRASMVRQVGFVGLDAGTDVVVKLYRPRGFSRLVLMNLRRPQWTREWRGAHALLQREVDVPLPIAWGEKHNGGLARQGAVVLLAVPESMSLLEALSERGEERVTKARTDVLGAAAIFVSGLHTRGVFHRDLHADNILLAPQGVGLRFFLLDLHRLRCLRRLSTKRRLLNLAQLLVSLQRVISETEAAAFLAHYVESGGWGSPPEAMVEDVKRLEEMLWRRHVRSRTRRCFKEGSQFSLHRLGAFRIIARRPFPVEVFPRLHEEARGIIHPDDPGVLKSSPSTRLTLHRLAVGGRDVRLCIKAYPLQGLVSVVRRGILPSRARAFWRGWWGLKVRGFRVPEAYLMWEKRRWGVVVDSGVVMQALEDALGLDRYVAAQFPLPLDEKTLRRKRALTVQMADLLSGLHTRGVLHRDLKAGNILVEALRRGWQVTLLDLESVRFSSVVSRRHRALNLAQLDASLPPCVTRWDRLRFLARYREREGDRQGRRRLAEEAARLSHLRRRRRP